MQQAQLTDTQEKLKYSLQRLSTYAQRAEAALCAGHPDRSNEYLRWLEYEYSTVKKITNPEG